MEAAQLKADASEPGLDIAKEQESWTMLHRLLNEMVGKLPRKKRPELE